jgi:DNA uptake protein ComE-like DNA-binding protein
MSTRRPGGIDSEVRGHTALGTSWELKQSWYFLFFFTVYLYWLPLVYMGLRVLQLRWIFYGLLYAGPGAVYLLLSAMGAPPEGSPDFAAAMHDSALRHARNATGAFAIFSLIHAWVARGEFLVRLADQESDVEEMRERTLTRMDPASQPGDVELAPPAPRRLLNVNQVTESELAMLPGLGPERAKQALRLREEMGDYLSFQDFAGKMQLTQEAAYRLRPLFEPDSDAVALAVPKDDPAYRLLPDGSRVLELNWASAEALGALPGLGPKIARRAVEIRDGDGPYKSLEDFRYRLSLPMDAMIKIAPYVSVISMSTTPGGGGAKKTGGRIVDV